MIRKPAVAGQFYPGSAAVLEREVQSYLVPGKEKEVLGVISPHAGYIYSGHVAGAVFSCIAVPDDVIILGPNHRGMGDPFAIMAEGSWQMPNGEVAINKELAALILKNSQHITDDYRAHTYEHSLEVQVPFLQALNKDFRLVPIALTRGSWKVCREIGESIARAIKDYGRKVLIVASSDMTHYESDKSARQKDKLAIDHILALDPQGLLAVVHKHDISMCGVIPATITLAACEELGATHAELVKYATSGDVSGDYLQVVGYAGLYIE